MGCCSPIQRRSCPWINNCYLIPKCIRLEWAKSDHYQAEAEMCFKRQKDWENSWEGQQAIREYKEEKQRVRAKANQEALAKRGPNWEQESAAEFRNKQLLCAIYNIGKR